MNISELQAWQGRTETLHDVLAPAPMAGLLATLDLDDANVAPGVALPPLWHWLYFLPRHRHRDVGPDGHARLGGFLPPVPLPRRMWAGGRLEWVQGNPLRIGDAVRRVSTIDAIVSKAGRSGELVFVQVRHEVSNDAGLALTEQQDIVYREASRHGEPGPAPVAAEEGADWRESVQADAVLLFRYSALTFNSHRIHYDLPYAMEEEGYSALVVHGPLIATLLADAARRRSSAAPFRSFAFKAVRPLLQGQAFELRGHSDPGAHMRLQAVDPLGALAMRASVVFDTEAPR